MRLPLNQWRGLLLATAGSLRRAPDEAGGAGTGGTAGASGAGGTAYHAGESGSAGVVSIGGAGGNDSGSGGSSANGGSGGNGGSSANGGSGGSGNAGGAGKLPCAVQEILEPYCITCHAKPPINGAPVSLVSFTDAKTYAEVMEMNVDGGQMPPPGAPGLSGRQAQTLLDYLAAGTPSAGIVSCP